MDFFQEIKNLFLIHFEKKLQMFSKSLQISFDCLGGRIFLPKKSCIFALTSVFQKYSLKHDLPWSLSFRWPLRLCTPGRQLAHPPAPQVWCWYVPHSILRICVPSVFLFLLQLQCSTPTLSYYFSPIWKTWLLCHILCPNVQELKVIYTPAFTSLPPLLHSLQSASISRTVCIVSAGSFHPRRKEHSLFPGLQNLWK